MASGYRYVDKAMSKDQLEKHGKRRSKYHTSIYKKTVETENINIVKKIIALAEKENRKVIMMTPPYSKYYVYTFKNEYLDNFYINVNNIIKSHKEVKYLDFSKDNSFNDDEFADSDHLNVQGAKKFSLMLNNIISNK